jgi:hypothetical protein
MENALAVHEPEVFELCDREDEVQILAEMRGAVVDKYLYSFQQSGATVTGLSYAGVNWACREYAKHGEVIRMISKPEILLDPTDPEYVIFSVVAQRFAVNIETGREVALDSAIGVKRQCVKRKRGDQVVTDEFYVEKGVSKAQRNAKHALLPAEFIKKVIAACLSPKPAAKTQAPAPAPAATPAPAAAPAPAAPAAVKPTPAKPAPAPAPGGSPSLANIRQRVWVLLKKIFGEDEGVCRAVLAELTGTRQVTDLGEDVIMKLGPALREVAEKKSSLVRSSGGTPAMIIASNGGTMFEGVIPPKTEEKEAPKEAAKVAVAASPEEELF